MCPRGGQMLQEGGDSELHLSGKMLLHRHHDPIRIGDLPFDIDCLDPAFAPGTGTPVAGGLSSAVALEILRGLAELQWVGMDIVEVAPAYDVGNITALAAASLAMEYLCMRASTMPERPPESLREG